MQRECRRKSPRSEPARTATRPRGAKVALMSQTEKRRARKSIWMVQTASSPPYFTAGGSITRQGFEGSYFDRFLMEARRPLGLRRKNGWWEPRTRDCVPPGSGNH